MKTSEQGRQFIESLEPLYLTGFVCPPNVMTIGYGHNFHYKGRPITNDTKITLEEADALLADDLVNIEERITALVTVPIVQNEFDAMVALAENISIEAFEKSSVLRFFNAGDRTATARAFMLWNRANINGELVVVEQLNVRRQAEAALFSGIIFGPQNLARLAGTVVPLPQDVVAPQPKVGMASIAGAGGASGIAGMGVILAVTKDVLNQFHEVAASVHDTAISTAQTVGSNNILIGLGIMTTAAGGFVAYKTWSKRRDNLAAPGRVVTLPIPEPVAIEAPSDIKS